jgi:hypothetical protein
VTRLTAAEAVELAKLWVSDAESRPHSPVMYGSTYGSTIDICRALVNLSAEVERGKAIDIENHERFLSLDEELRALRSSALTAEEREALARASRHFKGPNYEPGWTSWGDVIAVLVRLLAAEGEK